MLPSPATSGVRWCGIVGSSWGAVVPGRGCVPVQPHSPGWLSALEAVNTALSSSERIQVSAGVPAESSRASATLTRRSTRSS